MIKPRIVVFYSGSPDSSAALRTLIARQDADVVTLTVDVGQGGELQEVRERALAAGAVRAHVIDGRQELARDYALPALHAGVAPGGWPALVRTLSAPLIAAKLREIAAIEDATVAATTPPLDVEANLLGRVASGEKYILTKAAAAAPDSPAFVAITFDGGVPVAINDVALPLIELIESLALIAGQHGVGRIEGVEAPAAVILQAALHARVESTARLKLLKGAWEQVPELVSQS